MAESPQKSALLLRLSQDVLAEIFQFLPSRILLQFSLLCGNSALSYIIKTVTTEISLLRQETPIRLVEIPTFCFAEFKRLKTLRLVRHTLPTATSYAFLTSLPPTLTELDLQCDHCIDIWTVQAKQTPRSGLDSRFEPAWKNGPTLLAIDTLLPSLRSLSLSGSYFSRNGGKVFSRLPTTLERLIVPSVDLDASTSLPPSVMHLHCATLDLAEHNLEQWRSILVLIVNSVISGSCLPPSLHRLDVLDCIDTPHTFIEVSQLSDLRELRLESSHLLPATIRLPPTLTLLSIVAPRVQSLLNAQNALPSTLTELVLQETDDSIGETFISPSLVWPPSLTHLTLLMVSDAFIDSQSMQTGSVARVPLLPASLKSLVLNRFAATFFADPVVDSFQQLCAKYPSLSLERFSANPITRVITELTLGEAPNPAVLKEALSASLLRIKFRCNVKETTILELPKHILDIQCDRIIMSGEAIRHNHNYSLLSKQTIIDALVERMDRRLKWNQDTVFEWDKKEEMVDVRIWPNDRTLQSATSLVFPHIKQINWHSLVPRPSWFVHYAPNLEKLEYAAHSLRASQTAFPKSLTHLAINPGHIDGEMTVWKSISSLRLTHLDLFDISWPSGAKLPSTLTHLSLGDFGMDCDMTHLLALTSARVSNLSETFEKVAKFPKTLEKFSLSAKALLPSSIDPSLLPPSLKQLHIQQTTAADAIRMPKTLQMLEIQALDFDEDFAVECFANAPVSEVCDLDSCRWIVKWLRHLLPTTVLRVKTLSLPTNFSWELSPSFAKRLPSLTSIHMDKRCNALVKALPDLPKSITELKMRVNQILFGSLVAPHLMALDLRVLELTGTNLSATDISTLPQTLTRLKTGLLAAPDCAVPIAFPSSLEVLSLTLPDEPIAVNCLANLPQNLTCLTIKNAKEAICESVDFWAKLPRSLRSLDKKRSSNVPADIVALLESRALDHLALRNENDFPFTL